MSSFNGNRAYFWTRRGGVGANCVTHRKRENEGLCQHSSELATVEVVDERNLWRFD